MQQSTLRMAASQSLLDENTTSFQKSPMNQQSIFACTHGALATSPGKCDLPQILSKLVDHEMPVDKLSDLVSMFSFPEEGLGLANQIKLSIQIHHRTGQMRYKSEWSRGFSLDSAVTLDI
jgi:hypothetical protein